LSFTRRTALAIAGFVGLGVVASRPARGVAPPLFRDVAEESGLRFRHFTGASGQYFMPEIMGAGGALLDYDGDGDLDVLLLQGTTLDGSKPGARFTPAGPDHAQIAAVNGVLDYMHAIAARHLQRAPARPPTERALQRGAGDGCGVDEGGELGRRPAGEATRERVLEGVRRVADGIATAHGAEASVELTRGYPVTSNDASFACSGRA